MRAPNTDSSRKSNLPVTAQRPVRIAHADGRTREAIKKICVRDSHPTYGEMHRPESRVDIASQAIPCQTASWISLVAARQTRTALVIIRKYLLHRLNDATTR
jgi:hypothetical protein